MAKKTEYAQGTPCWIDVQTTDQDAAKEFYTSLLGWSYDDRPMPGTEAVYSMAVLNGEHGGGDRADAAGSPGRHAADVEHVPRGGRRRRGGREGRPGRRPGADATDGHHGLGPDGVRDGSDGRAGGAVAGESAHRRDAGEPDRRADLERVDHEQAGRGAGRSIRRWSGWTTQRSRWGRARSTSC